MKLFSILILLTFTGAQWLYHPKPSAIVPWKPHNATSVGNSGIYKNQYYLADRSDAAVQVINITSTKHVVTIRGFRGLVPHPRNTSYAKETAKSNLEQSGPNGIAILPDKSELYVGDGDGTVRVISLVNNSIVANISTGARRRTSAVAYCEGAGIIFVTDPNIEENRPQGFFIDPLERQVAGQVTFNSVNTNTLIRGHHVTSSLSQIAFKPGTDRFYVSSRSTYVNPGGEIIEVDPFTMSISNILGLDNCYPLDVVFCPNGNLFVGCSSVQELSSPLVNGSTGYSLIIEPSKHWSIVGNVSGVSGVYQAAYSSGLGAYFAAAYRERTVKITSGNSSNDTTPHEIWRSAPQLAIINSTTHQVQQWIETDNRTGRTVAVDPATQKLVVPLRRGITIYQLQSNATEYWKKSVAARTVLDSYVGVLPLVFAIAAFFL
ncbi:uncharacterized protein TRUGW13939_07544 [Talaromyces rugulosus]|uniref:SMP-30/Gluconolactonase/LRE-like region domain-containing protein n=1 Tax=Talaromyces rugulosus TaxID=121627 RepID=A0A7H8R210_TALRU|nr:uncharacterized protein TRUGW13939_07544 [Talaromyces rugulosus]QKX60399.1 hypothetical protein TRUGW13939_07544 [Talaromyces rugulosus]